MSEMALFFRTHCLVDIPGNVHVDNDSNEGRIKSSFYPDDYPQKGDKKNVQLHPPFTLHFSPPQVSFD